MSQQPSESGTNHLDVPEGDAQELQDRARLAKQLDELKPLILTVDDETLEVKPNPQASFILVSQDEKIHHSNDQQKRYWSDGTNTVLPKKSQGRTIMTSDFLSEVFGFIKFSDHDSHSPGKRVGSLLDVSRDGYYNSDRCLEDFNECSRAVTELSLGKLHCVYLTDRSPIHYKFAEDALNVRKMNVKPGGKQPKMRNGWFWKAGKRQTQTMVYPDDHPEYPGQAKGLRQVCVERFGEATINGKRHEEMAAMLSDCADFKSQPTLLEDQALARGDRVIFGVKFHPELAPIEAAYRSIGRALQVANSAGSSAGFKARVQQCQDPPDLTLSLVRKHFRSAREYLKLYVEGKTLAEIEQLRKVKRKHRGPAPALSQAGEASQPSKSGKYPRNRV
ncbi:hypothetical protein FOZ60_012833 [Perkinsus olseni]|uniref:Uncharacterized protein n=1 Tax=Perkinsus olseni TaxID=32597 RepID=A0A7J6NDA0_PEROL|nr:hypothetical protein FOZ60_012833 [Perkinsus olseni]